MAREKPLVLVADDDEDILTLVGLRLERAGYAVVTAKDGLEALAAAEAHPIEETGRKLRGLMSWVSTSDDYTGTAARN